MDRRRCLRPVGHTRGMDNTGACPDTFGEDLARVDRETADLLTTVATMTVGDLAEPARCVGWTRAHVIGHLARNADSLVNLATWAITGVPTPQYPSAEQRAADIQRSAAQSLAELQADLTASAQRCREALAALAGELTSPKVTLRSGVTCSAYELPTRRVNELVIHHFDLRAKWSLRDASPQSLLGVLQHSIAWLAQHPDAPSMVLRADEGEEYVLHDERATGQPVVTVRGSRAGLVAWLTRGVNAHVRADTTLPELPDWG